MDVWFIGSARLNVSRCLHRAYLFQHTRVQTGKRHRDLPHRVPGLYRGMPCRYFISTTYYVIYVSIGKRRASMRHGIQACFECSQSERAAL